MSLKVQVTRESPLPVYLIPPDSKYEGPQEYIHGYIEGAYGATYGRIGHRGSVKPICSNIDQYNPHIHPSFVHTPPWTAYQLNKLLSGREGTYEEPFVIAIESTREDFKYAIAFVTESGAFIVGPDSGAVPLSGVKIKEARVVTDPGLSALASLIPSKGIGTTAALLALGHPFDTLGPLVDGSLFNLTTFEPGSIATLSLEGVVEGKYTGIDPNTGLMGTNIPTELIYEAQWISERFHTQKPYDPAQYEGGDPPVEALITPEVRPVVTIGEHQLKGLYHYPHSPLVAYDPGLIARALNTTLSNVEQMFTEGDRIMIEFLRN